MTPSKAFFDQQDPINVTYLYKGDTPGDVRIELVDRDSGSVVKSWVQQNVAPQSYATFSWDGLLDEETAAPSGSYKFRVGPDGGELEDGGADELLHALRPHLPGARQAQLRRRRRCAAQGPHPPGPGRDGELRHAARRRARRPGPVRAATRARPATTS